MKPSVTTLRALFRPTFGALLGLFLILMVVVVGSARLFGDSDTATHVATGQWILEHHEVPKVDPFARTRPGMPWFAHEWLADVGMALVHRVGGWEGMVAACAITIVSAHLLLFRFLVRRGNDAVVSFFVVMSAASCACSHWLARPHLLTVLCLVVATIVLEEASSRRRSGWWVLWLAPLGLIWANLHGGFMILPATIACYLVGALWQSRGKKGRRARSLIVPLVAGLLATATAVMINPWGWRLPAHLVAFFGHHGEALAATAEFEPPSMHDRAGVAFAIFLFLCLAAIGASAWASSGRRTAGDAGSVHPGIVLAFLMSATMTCLSIRHVEVMAVFGALVLAGGASAVLRTSADEETRERLEALRLREAGGGGGLVAAALLLVMLLALIGGLPHAGFDPAVFPVELVSDLKRAAIVPSGPVFTPDIWGGYLLLELPGAGVFVDGRWDMRGDAYFRRYSSIYLARPTWSRLLEEDGVEWALLPLDAPLAQAMRASAGWSLWRTETNSVAFRRRL